MKKNFKRLTCLMLVFIFIFNVTTFASDTSPEDFEDDSTNTNIDFSEPTDTTIDDTVWTREYDDGTEEIVTYDDLNPNPYLRWNTLSAVNMDLDFKTGGKAVFATSVAINKMNCTIKIVTKLQSYRSSTWKTLYTKTKTSGYTATTNSGSYYVTKGYKYRTRNTITVYNSSGKVIETDTLNCTRTYN